LRGKNVTLVLKLLQIRKPDANEACGWNAKPAGFGCKHTSEQTVRKKIGERAGMSLFQQRMSPEGKLAAKKKTRMFQCCGTKKPRDSRQKKQ